MPIIPFGEWRPDVSDYEASTQKGVLNVVPRGDGYGPFPSLAAISQSLGFRCMGAIAAYKTDGTVVVFASSSTNLYLFNNTTFGWSNVSKAGGPYAGLSTGELWQFRQFNNLVIAVQGNVVPQVFDISSASVFSDLAGSPPQARYIDIVGKFAVLNGIQTAPNRIKWSGLNDVNGVNSWTAGINSSDEQDLPDGGFCRGIAGGEIGVIMQDTIVRSMTYLPGDPRVFQITKIAEGLGIFGSYSLLRSGSSVFFYSLKGFHRVDAGGAPGQIGRERVDTTFFADLDRSALDLFQGIADPRSSRVLWVYKSNNGVAGQFDKALCYDPVLDKFTPLKFSGELVFNMSQPGVTLEQIPALLGTNLDAITQSFDNFRSSVAPELAAFDVGHNLGFFRGPSLEATLETAEQGSDVAPRIKLKKGIKPISDAPAVFGSASKRETLDQTATYTAESARNAVTGICNMLVDSRYSRFKLRIPSGTAWTFANGVEPEPKGQR
jgi:hypothetical protein